MAGHATHRLSQIKCPRALLNIRPRPTSQRTMLKARSAADACNCTRWVQYRRVISRRLCELRIRCSKRRLLCASPTIVFTTDSKRLKTTDSEDLAAQGQITRTFSVFLETIFPELLSAALALQLSEQQRIVLHMLGSPTFSEQLLISECFAFVQKSLFLHVRG